MQPKKGFQSLVGSVETRFASHASTQKPLLFQSLVGSVETLSAQQINLAINEFQSLVGSVETIWSKRKNGRRWYVSISGR